MMDTRQLGRILKEHLRLSYYGVCAEDELPDTINDVRRPLAIIVNTDPSSQDGTHWTAIYLHRNGSGEFFDSFGRAPDKPVKRFLDRHASNGWSYNIRTVQALFSTLCGAYCVQYLEARHQNKTLPFSTLLFRLFPYTAGNNENLVQHRMRVHYNLRIPIYDLSFLDGRGDRTRIG